MFVDSGNGVLSHLPALPEDKQRESRMMAAGAEGGNEELALDECRISIRD